ncbi:zinc finger, CCHC-type containing protein [Tanacetum coccineum]
MPSLNEDQIGETPIETPTTRKSNRARVTKSFGYDFQLYLVEGSRDEIGTQYSYYYSIEEDPRTSDKAMLQTFGLQMDLQKKIKVYGTIDKLLIALAATYNLVIHQMDVKTTFLNYDLEEEVYMKQPEGFIMPGIEHKDIGEADVILGIKIKHEDKGVTITQSYYIEKILKKFKCDDCCPVSTPLDMTIKLMPNTDRAVDQLEYSRAIGCLMYAMTSIRPNISYAMGKLILEGYSDASWITNSEDHTSTAGWVFLLSGSTISWDSKNQTCIIDSTMEEEFVALAVFDKEAQWLRNLIYEILLWPKPISPISIHCDSATTLAKAYCQIYNGKSRHLGVRHSMVHELITNGGVLVIGCYWRNAEVALTKHKVKRSMKVPVVCNTLADIPRNEYSWRKYGHEPTKGSSHSRWCGTDPPFSSAIRDHMLNQTSCADSYGPSSSFRTRERTSPENQISSQVHAQFNATTTDTAADNKKRKQKRIINPSATTGKSMTSNDWCFDRPRTESGFVRAATVEQFLVLFFPLRFPHLYFFCGTLMILALDAFFTW